jgi:hypothetical protein
LNKNREDREKPQKLPLKLLKRRVTVPIALVTVPVFITKQCKKYPAIQGFFQFFIQHCIICRQSDFTMSEDAGIKLRTVATSALAVRRSNHSAKSHPQVPKILKNIQGWRIQFFT